MSPPKPPAGLPASVLAALGLGSAVVEGSGCILGPCLDFAKVDSADDTSAQVCLTFTTEPCLTSPPTDTYVGPCLDFPTGTDTAPTTSDTGPTTTDSADTSADSGDTGLDTGRDTGEPTATACLDYAFTGPPPGGDPPPPPAPAADPVRDVLRRDVLPADVAERLRRKLER